jgi:hypothetical protein
MGFVKFAVVAAMLGLAACNGPNPDPNAGNAMGEYRGPSTTQAAPPLTPVQPNGGSMAIPPASGGMVVAAPAREAQQPQGGANAIPPTTGAVTRSTR